jgi:hypothetical protein
MQGATWNKEDRVFGASHGYDKTEEVTHIKQPLPIKTDVPVGGIAATVIAVGVGIAYATRKKK